MKRLWPWLLALGTFALAVGALATGGLAGTELVDIAAMVIVIAAAAALDVMGALLVTRVRSNPIGYLLLASGILMSIGIAALTYGELGTAAGPDSWPGLQIADLVGQAFFQYSLVITLVGVPLVFPTGRFLSKRWRWVAWLIVVAMVSLTGSMILGQAVIGDRPGMFASDSTASIAQVLEAFSSASAFIGFGAAVASVAIRFRRSSGEERQQLKWLVAVAAWAGLVFPLALIAPNEAISDALFMLALAAFALFPVAIGIAVLRYRLYEIDRIISRTIGWAVVTGLLVGAFALLVLVSSAVLEPLTGGNTLAVAASTLVVALLFSPLRSRVQRTVDWRFDRSRYDGERTLDAFGERLRDEVDLTTIRADVLTTVDTSVRPTRVGLWLRGPEGET